MCKQFVDFKQLSESQEVNLRDGYAPHGTGIGTVEVEMLLPDRNTRKCTLQKVFMYRSSRATYSVSQRRQKWATLLTSTELAVGLKMTRKS